MNVVRELEAEFNEWYNNEHIPALAAVPGVLCARRFRGDQRQPQVRRALPPRLARRAGDSGRGRARADSEWTRKLRPHFRDHLRLVCRRYARSSA